MKATSIETTARFDGDGNPAQAPGIQAGATEQVPGPGQAAWPHLEGTGGEDERELWLPVLGVQRAPTLVSDAFTQHRRNPFRTILHVL